MHWKHVIILGTRYKCWGTRASQIRVFDIHVVMEFEKILGRMRKMTVANHNRQHQRTLDTFLLPNL
jgi:homoserine trans-succinylase